MKPLKHQKLKVLHLEDNPRDDERTAAALRNIAHEINNVLLPIVLAAEMLQTDSTAEDRSDWIEIIANSARRGQQIIQRLTKVSNRVEA